MERNRYGSAEGVVLAVIWVLWMEINSRIFEVFEDLIKRELNLRISLGYGF